MGQIHRITLTHKCGNVPKGTTIEVPTTNKNDHGASAWIPNALRKAGYADADFQGCSIGSSTNWDWTPIPGDSTELSNELGKYWKPVESPSEETNSSSKKEKKKKKKKSESSSDGGDGKGFFGLDRWDPLNILLFIIFLPFLIIWWVIKLVLKLCGIWAIINFFTGGDD
ncbi:MAG: hypothetical protein K2H38_02865 [Muribaculaceae bacterium]|nr:hypothetical protein [Muribaculaceae bacterium]